MGKLRNYELSLWKDVFKDGEPNEQKMYVFGSDELQTQARAQEPKLKRNVNGSNELTFKMFYQYVDNITGNKVTNPFIGDLVNEAKIKLKFKNKWYDFIIKSVTESTSGKTLSYVATDLHINELSKNGFGLTLDNSLGNSIDNVERLANRIFEDTDWKVDASEIIPQTLDESLIEITILQDITAVQLKNDTTIAPTEQPGQIIPAESKIYLFYSCCKNKTERLQFIYVPSNITTNSERIITNTNSQYYIDGVNYTESEQSKKYGLYQPDYDIATFSISSQYRGRRFVFSSKSLYHAVLDKYVIEYKNSNNQLLYGFTETEYISPNIIQNIITNTDFKSNSGWQGKYRTNSNTPENTNKNTLYGAEVTTKSYPDVLQKMIDGTYDPDEKVSTYIDLNFKVNTEQLQSVVVNSSFYDFRKKFKGFSAGQKFVLLYHQCADFASDPLYEAYNSQALPFKVQVGEQIFSVNEGNYNFSFTTGKPFLVFNSENSQQYSNEDHPEYNGYKYVIAQVDTNYNLTEQDYAKLKVQTFITLDNSATGNIGFYDFQIFPYYSKTTGSTIPLLPIDSVATAEAKTTYCFFDPALDSNINALSKEEMTISKYDEKPTDIVSVFPEGAEKINTLEVSKSNYFNACQKLCEVFECWADFEITHDENGYITDKIVRFKNYIGKDNFSGFRYGVNLKDIQRKVDSKKIVTKLMVTNNNNKYAQNGFCTIARAGSNETGESYIYDFSYYINHQMLSRDDMADLFYNTDAGCGPDLIIIDPNHTGKDQPVNCQGYYIRLSKLNKELDKITEALLSYSKPLMQAQADVTTYESMVMAAEEKYNTNVASFRQSAGFEYTDVLVEGDAEETARRQQIINKNTTIRGYLTKIIEFLETWNEGQKSLELAKSQLDSYQQAYNNLQDTFETYNQWKKDLNKYFFKKYYRYIQEGTWIDNDQNDDEKYYIDALSVAYNSCQSQVSYTINVMALENISGYEGFSFDLADKTFIEDVEYFGYDDDGNPYREEVVITEINYVLDELDKDTLKIQNYKNQFQDLFQGITASVQSVNYTSGAWDNAADFTTANDAKKSSFLQNALNHVDTVLTNAGEQSVVWDKTGITITDNKLPNQQMRIIAGGLFLRDEDNDGLGWKAGITPDGINAKLITSGQVNTGVVQIMRDDEPYFRWDDHGITAYHFTEEKESYITNFNTKRGVRFDRFGIYGYDMYENFTVDGEDVIDGLVWHPDSLEEVRENSLFSLTWDGLLLKIGCGYYTGSTGTAWHSSTTLLGKTDGQLYNGWDANNKWNPIINNPNPTEEFVKVFSAGKGQDLDYEETIAIFDNGTLLAKEARISGTIIANEGYIGGQASGWKIDENSITTGEFGSTDSFHMYSVGKRFDSAYGQDNLDWAMGVGQNFGLTVNGILYINEAHINGHITGGTININNNFNVYENGDAELAGNVKIGGKTELGGDVLMSGNITWSQDSSPTQVVYAREKLNKPNNNTKYEDFPETDNFGWHREFNTSNDRYASYTYDGGNTWGQPIQVAARDGADKFNCYIESSLGDLVNNSLDDNTVITLTAYIFIEDTQIDESGTQLEYAWYLNNIRIEGESSKHWETTLGTIKEQEIYFSATEK